MVILIIATFLSFIIKGMCGFANTVAFGSIAGFTANGANRSPLELLIGYPSNIVMAWKARKSISLRDCLPLSFFLLIGSIPGAILLKNAGTGYTAVILGLMIVLIGTGELLGERFTKKQKSSRILLPVLGNIAGILSGLFGIEALLAAYLIKKSRNTRAFRGNLCLVLCLENTIRIVVYSFSGILTMQILKSGIMLIPAMLLGLFIGIHLSKRVEEKMAKQVVFYLLIISGVSLFVQGL